MVRNHQTCGFKEVHPKESSSHEDCFAIRGRYRHPFNGRSPQPLQVLRPGGEALFLSLARTLLRRRLLDGLSEDVLSRNNYPCLGQRHSKGHNTSAKIDPTRVLPLLFAFYVKSLCHRILSSYFISGIEITGAEVKVLVYANDIAIICASKHQTMSALIFS